jgi:hypothetical protein
MLHATEPGKSFGVAVDEVGGNYPFAGAVFVIGSRTSGSGVEGPRFKGSRATTNHACTQCQQRAALAHDSIDAHAGNITRHRVAGRSNGLSGDCAGYRACGSWGLFVCAPRQSGCRSRTDDAHGLLSRYQLVFGVFAFGLCKGASDGKRGVVSNDYRAGL